MSNDVYAHDIDAMKAISHFVESLEKIQSSYVLEGRIKVAVSDGYILGSIYFDTNAETWRWDLSENGNDLL